ncbi:hypothetical protein CRM79_21850 [Pantoea agglomerans]|nr:hypothetical protein CRM79_21850 [Pantoea agglomerans]
MFSRVRVVSGLLCVLALFALLQLFSGGMFFKTVSSDKENFAYNQRLNTLQQAMGTSWVSLVQARNTLNRAGIRFLQDAQMAGSGASVKELVALAGEELKQAEVNYQIFNDNLSEQGKTAENVVALQANYKAYHDALAELMVFFTTGNFKGFVDQPTQSFQDKFQKDYSAWLENNKALSQQGVEADVFWQLYSHFKKLKMSMQEIRDEHKQQEGDPHVKGRIRQQMRAAARRRMMADVPKADVIVTNPTHYSVALQYNEKKMSAPKVVAKGAGEIALRIRELAAEHRIPVLEAPPLARALYRHTEIGQHIPGALYAAVAEVLAWVWQSRRWKREGGLIPAKPKNLPVPAEMDFAGESKNDG